MLKNQWKKLDRRRLLAKAKKQKYKRQICSETLNDEPLFSQVVKDRESVEALMMTIIVGDANIL